MTINGGKLYEVIYADPPWRYAHTLTANRRIENHYPTMADADICKMAPVIPAANNCVLYLWAVAPKVDAALTVIKAWGFTYKTQAVWDKVKMGMGYWFRGQHELIMVATKGKVKPPAQGLRIPSVIRCKRGKHSAKPDYVRAMIEKWYPGKSRLELFTRIKRPGWDAYGNEVEVDLLSNLGGSND